MGVKDESITSEPGTGDREPGIRELGKPHLSLRGGPQRSLGADVAIPLVVSYQFSVISSLVLKSDETATKLRWYCDDKAMIER